MARKNLLSGLTNPELPAGNSSSNNQEGEDRKAQVAPHFGVMGTRGAIGAVTRSIEQLKSQSVADLDPDFIENSFVTDRLQGSAEDHTMLVASIREHGQQVPVLVRPHPEKSGWYQLAYGHRRVRALADLGRKVRAVVKPLTDAQLVVAQGQENSARTDLSFIERALFAAKLEDGGFERETIMAALSVDKTGLSRLISAAAKVPREIIEAIGPAPKAGRDRWLNLAEKLSHQGAVHVARVKISEPEFAEAGSDERFNKLFDAFSEKKPNTAQPELWTSADGKAVAQIKQDERNVTLVVNQKVAPDFGAYLIKALPEIYAAFKRGEDR
jgi:ParB family chromosome partitioning protein